MAKIFICDNCNKQFPSPLDEEKFKDEHGVWHSFDLCAPCRQVLREGKRETEHGYFDKIIKEKKR